MRALAASVGLTICVLSRTVPAVAAEAPPPAPIAAMSVIFSVCREAAVQGKPPAVFAEQLGLEAEPVPRGVVIAKEGTKSWRVPSSTGEVYVLSGAIPEPAQPSACVVAIYGDPMTGFEDALTTRITEAGVGFERDAKQSFTTDRFRVTHYDSSQGYLVRNVMAVRPLVMTPDHPSLSIISYRVDYSWLKSISH
jgi:hypothetical protein